MSEILSTTPDARDHSTSSRSACSRLESTPHSTRLTRIVLSWSVFSASLGTSIVQVTLPTLCRHFERPYAHVQWVMLAYLLSSTCSAVIAGKCGDLWGRRRTLTIGMAVFLIGSLLCALAPNLLSLILARGIQGLGASVMLVMATALMAETSQSARAGTALGWLATMSALGTALGPPLGGLLLADFGWRSIHLLFAVLAGAHLILSRSALSTGFKIQDEPTKPLDYKGGLLLISTLTLLCLALSAHQTALRNLTLPILLSAILSAWLFIHTERRHPHPLLQWSILSHLPTLGTLAIHALVTAVMMTTIILGPFYLSTVLQLPDRAVGFSLALGPTLTALVATAAGKVIDRYHPAPSTLAALLGMVLGCLALPFLAVHGGLVGYLTGIGWITSHYALFQTANQTGLFQKTASAHKGVVSGLLTLSRNLGLLAGTAALGMLFHSNIRMGVEATLSDVFIQSVMKKTFHTEAVLLIAAVLVHPLLGRKKTVL